jgi:integrase
MGKDLRGKELGKGLLQRKDGMYCGRYNDLFGVRQTLYNRDLRILEREMQEAIYEMNNRTNIVEDKTTLDDWYSKWLFVYKNPVIRPSTKMHYEHIYRKHISPSLGKFKICEITQLQIKALINKLNDSGYQWETQNKVRVLLIDMFNRAMEDNFVRRNPAKSVRLSKVKPNDRVVLTTEEQALFFECSTGTFYDNLFVVAVNTGLRPGELFALTRDDINFDDMTISVSKTLLYQKLEGDTKKEFHLGDPKTKQSVRYVPINKHCEIALKKQYIQKTNISRRGVKETELPDCLFTTRYNTPLNSVLYSDAIRKIVEEINLMRDSLEQIDSFGGHTFRHTFATRCIEAGVQPKTL